MHFTVTAHAAAWTVAAALVLGSASASSSDTLVRGTATYRERIAMPPGAVLEVTLEDVSLADAPAGVIAKVRLENIGNPPYEFEVPYDPAQIDDRQTYAVRARLLFDGQLMFTSDTHHPVLTRGAGDEVAMVLVRAGLSHGADAADRGVDTAGLHDLPATFEGVLPCADCEGIRYHLDLFEDEAFFLRTAYLGRGDDAVFDDIGSWAVSSDGSRLALFGGREAPLLFRIVEPNTLRTLDIEGREIDSDLNDDLERASEFTPIEPRLAMRGMYRYMADAALFEECLTGKSLPVAMEADNIALERGYRESGVEPGQPVLVILEGRLARRPAMESEGTVLSLVPERFIGVWPGETCGPRMANAELLNTYWKLTRVGDGPVIFGRQQREPHMVLHAQENRLSGSGGCNRLVGGFEIDGREIAFAQMASTMMACPEEMNTEQAFSDALSRARTWRVIGSHLELYDEQGQMVARFEARHMD